MVKKAKLDLLEEKIGEKEKAETVAPDEKEHAREPLPGWFTTGRILAIILSAGILICATVFSVSMYSRGKTVKNVPVTLLKQIAAPPAVSTIRKEEIASLRGFVIHVKDAKGNYRTLICDIALALNNPEGDIKRFEQRVDVRTLIYMTAKNRGASLLDSRDDRNQLRREISDKLNGLLGGNKVNAVYFTEFVIL